MVDGLVLPVHQLYVDENLKIIFVNEGRWKAGAKSVRRNYVQGINPGAITIFKGKPDRIPCGR